MWAHQTSPSSWMPYFSLQFLTSSVIFLLPFVVKLLEVTWIAPEDGLEVWATADPTTTAAAVTVTGLVPGLGGRSFFPPSAEAPGCCCSEAGGGGRLSPEGLEATDEDREDDLDPLPPPDVGPPWATVLGLGAADIPGTCFKYQFGTRNIIWVTFRWPSWPSLPKNPRLWKF